MIKVKKFEFAFSPSGSCGISSEVQMNRFFECNPDIKLLFVLQVKSITTIFYEEVEK